MLQESLTFLLRRPPIGDVLERNEHHLLFACLAEWKSIQLDGARTEMRKVALKLEAFQRDLLWRDSAKELPQTRHVPLTGRQI